MQPEASELPSIAALRNTPRRWGSVFIALGLGRDAAFSFAESTPLLASLSA
jgi:hypothetical protein